MCEKERENRTVLSQCFFLIPELKHSVRFHNLEKRLREAYEQLKKRGIPLASNQVNYSLIYRLPEENGVKTACDELGITLIAYSPIAQGKSAQVVSNIIWFLFVL